MFFAKKIKKPILLILLLGWVIHFGFAQSDSVLLTKNFKFQDGVFMTLEAFQNNQPTYSWKQIEAGVFSNPQTFLTQIHYLNLLEGKEKIPIDLNEIWGISLDGIPYVQLEKEELRKENAVFAALRLRGKICYLKYEVEVKKMIPMSVYNPLTGRPFRTMNVERKFPISFEKMMHFETGGLEDFTLENLKHWIKEDDVLLQTLEDLKPSEVDDKLFKCLLIFVDRNEQIIPNVKAN